MQSTVSRASAHAPSLAGQTVDRRASIGSLTRHPDVLLALGLFALALLPRLLYVLWAPVFIGGDSLRYFQPVYDLMNGRGFTLPLKRPPLYPWLLYASQVTFGPSFVPVIAFQHLLGAITVALTYGIGRLAWAGSDVMRARWIGMIAALLVAFSSPTLRWEHFLMSDGPFTFLYTLLVFLMVLGLRRPRWYPWAAAGLVLGLAILMRSAGQVVFFMVPPMILLVERSWKAAIVKTALMFAVCAVVVVPWMLRNQAVWGTFTTAGAAGQNLATFTAIIHLGDFSFDEPLVTAVDADPKMKIARLEIRQGMLDKMAKPQNNVSGLAIFTHIRDETKMSEPQADKAMQEIAMRAILARPAVYVRDVAQNIYSMFMFDTSKVNESLEYHWNLWDDVGWKGAVTRYIGPATPQQEASYPHLAVLDGIEQPARIAGPLLVLFVVGIGLALFVPGWRPVLAVAMAALALIGVSAATVGAVPRYRVPAEPMIDVVAIGALVVLASWGWRRLRRPPTA
jgi:hypothetical protein